MGLFLKECYKNILKMMHNTLLRVRIVAYVSVNEFLVKAFYYVRSAGPKSGQHFSAFFFMTRSQACHKYIGLTSSILIQIVLADEQGYK